MTRPVFPHVRLVAATAFAIAAALSALQPAQAAGAASDASGNTSVLADLPPLGAAWRTENPYRGDARAVLAGEALYRANCQRCHGEEASGRGPAPTLQLIGRFCRRVGDAGLKRRCLADADEHFRRSVLKGKVLLGVEHMPPWEGILPQEAVWALRSYVESRGRK